MKESTKKEIRWHLRNLLNVAGFGSGGYDPITGQRGPYVSLKESEKLEERERRFYDSPLFRH